MQWESSGIYVWFFPRNNIPSDITSGHPCDWKLGTADRGFQWREFVQHRLFLR